MRVVFYSTNPYAFKKDAIERINFPSCKSDFLKLTEKYTDCDFYIVTEEPGVFLLDQEDFYEMQEGRVHYSVFPQGNTEALTKKIISLNPDKAIACSYWAPPYDWQSLGDALIAEELRLHGIQTLCHSTQTCLLCMDKLQFQLFLMQNGFCAPKSVYIRHDLFWAERRHKEIISNIYKEEVFKQISKMRYPVVIKDTAGLSSYKMETAVSFLQARSFLLSKKNDADKIVQEYIQGAHCGVEIWAGKEKTSILPPLRFSLNQYGITSPKQSVKLGPISPILSEKLQSELLRLSSLLKLNGPAQVDFILSEEKMYIIEVNPRLSGMTHTYAALFATSPLAMLAQTALTNGLSQLKPLPFVCNIKLPLCKKEQLKKLYDLPFAASVHQIFNKEAKQEREKGYGELVLTANSQEEICAHLDFLQQEFPECMEASFVQKAKELARANALS